MAFLDKLMFWKKKDDFDTNIGNFGADNTFGTGAGTGAPDMGYGNQDFGMPEAQFGQQLPTSQFGQAPPMFPGTSQGAGFPQPTPFAPQQSQQDFMVGKDIEIISAKLDSLRAYLDSINQRLANIERIAMGDQEKRRGW